MIRALLLPSVVFALTACVGTSSVRSWTGPEDDPDANYNSEWVLERAFRFGVRAHQSELGGDFDGNTVILGPDETTVPDAGEGDGYEIMLGGISEGTGFEFSYTRLNYDDVQYENIALNGLYFLRPNERLQPYFLLGVLFPWARLDDASTDGVVFGDGKLRGGLGLQVGVGLSWFVSTAIALDVRAQYVFQEFTEAEGVLGIEGDIDDGIFGDSLSVSAGLTFSIPLRNQ